MVKTRSVSREWPVVSIYKDPIKILGPQFSHPLCSFCSYTFGFAHDCIRSRLWAVASEGERGAECRGQSNWVWRARLPLRRLICNVTVIKAGKSQHRANLDIDWYYLLKGPLPPASQQYPASPKKAFAHAHTFMHIHKCTPICPSHTNGVLYLFVSEGETHAFN